MIKEAQHRRLGSVDKSSGSAWARKIKARPTPSLFWLKSRTPGSHEKLFCASSFWTLNSSSLRMTQQLDNNFFSLAAEIETGKMFFRPDAIKTSLAFLSTTTCQTKGSGFISGLKFNFFWFPQEATRCLLQCLWPVVMASEAQHCNYGTEIHRFVSGLELGFDYFSLMSSKVGVPRTWDLQVTKWPSPLVSELEQAWSLYKKYFYE